MKKNDIIDKLNIIDRKIDELTYLNVSAIVDVAVKYGAKLATYYDEIVNG